MVSCHESKSSADMRTASPALELILTGTWSSLTCWMRGNRRERASLALTATASTSFSSVRLHGTREVQASCTRVIQVRTAPAQHARLPYAISHPPLNNAVPLDQLPCLGRYGTSGLFGSDSRGGR